MSISKQKRIHSVHVSWGDDGKISRVATVHRNQLVEDGKVLSTTDETLLKYTPAKCEAAVAKLLAELERIGGEDKAAERKRSEEAEAQRLEEVERQQRRAAARSRGLPA